MENKEEFTNEEYGLLIAKQIFRELEGNGYLPKTKANLKIKDKWTNEENYRNKKNDQNVRNK